MPVAASRSATGVRAIVPPLQPSASYRCWSVVMKRIFRPMSTPSRSLRGREEDLERPALDAMARREVEERSPPGFLERGVDHGALAPVQGTVRVEHALHHPERV